MPAYQWTLSACAMSVMTGLSWKKAWQNLTSVSRTCTQISSGPCTQAQGLGGQVSSGGCRTAHKQKALVKQLSRLHYLGQGNRMQPRLPRVHVRLALIVGPAHATAFTIRAQQAFESAQLGQKAAQHHYLAGIWPALALSIGINMHTWGGHALQAA